MFKRMLRNQAMKHSLISPILLASISYFWLFNTILNTWDEMSPSDISLVLGLTTVVLAAQAVLLIFAKGVARILFPAFALANTYFLYIVLSEDIVTMNVWVQVGICAAIMALYWVILDIVLRAGPMRSRLVLGAPVLVIVFVGASFLFLLTGKEGGEAEAATPANIKTVEFKSKPNIYFLSFDAMIPESLSGKLLDVPTPPYIDVLRKHNARLIKNNFADALPTKVSLANILNMGPAVLVEAEAIKVVNGSVPSPLRHILTANGYTTHFTFESGFFGPSKGKYLNRYNVHEPYSACRYLTGDARRFGFYGYCPLRDVAGLNPTGDNPRSPAFLDYTYGLIGRIAKDKNSGPHFYMQHILYPSHTMRSFVAGAPRHQKAYKSYFEERSTIAAEAMDRMLSEIRASDPTAIIFLYGDHGTIVSRSKKFAEDKAFFVQDRHGTLGALINAETCTPYLTPPNGERFQTNAKIVAGLVQCLAGGESPFINQVDFGAIRQIPNERFEDYVYE